MVSDCPSHKELLLKERIRSLWERILSFKEVPILKRDAIEENHWLFQLSPFDVCNLFSVLATPLDQDKKFGKPTVGFYGTLVLVLIKTCQKCPM